MRILITGSNGLLGQKIVDYCLQNNIHFLATSQGENRYSKIKNDSYLSMDISNENEVENVVKEYQPDTIINTAAITNVDFCESNHDLCDRVNVSGVKVLADVCSRHNSQLIHLSTDFVFDGENGPYKETDERNPLSYYGNSKLKSEEVLQNHFYNNWAILRTIIVFGIGENMSRSNIVLWAKSALEKGDELTIVDDQFRAPTFAEDLAKACMFAAEKKARGIFHISGPETFSILELVNRVAKSFGLEATSVKPISSSSLNQAARRPPRTGFDISKARNILGYNPLSFEESLEVLKVQMKKN